MYTSTVGALGIPKDGAPGTEDTPVSLADMVGPYKTTKFLGQQVALELARRGLPVVIVNPSAPIGPWDIKPTPTGQMIVDFMAGKMFATLDTGLNLVHVRDVAQGHMLAAEHGRVGQTYILGAARGTSRWPRSVPSCRSSRAGRPACRCRTRWPGAAPPAWSRWPASPAARRGCR